MGFALKDSFYLVDIKIKPINKIFTPIAIQI